MTTCETVKTCEFCGAELRPHPAGRPQDYQNKRFCNKSCTNAARRARAAVPVETKECIGCLEVFRRPKGITAREWEARRYCKARCGQGAPRPKAVEPEPVSRRARMWTEQAACHGHDPLFDAPESLVHVDWALWRRVARTWCGGCPVRAECLADAERSPRADWGCGLRGGVLRYYRRGRVHSFDLLADDVELPDVDEQVAS